jgi:hypothetical protein
MSSVAVEPNEAPSAADEQWSVAQAVRSGQPLLIRFRNQRPAGATSAEFPFLLSATWSYQANAHGLPTAEELASMDRFEDALASSLDESQTAHLMVVLTGSGDRDWLWYAVSEEAAMSRVNQALKGHPRYPLQFSVQKDRAWRAWTQFAGSDDSQAGSRTSLPAWLMAKAAQIFGRGGDSERRRGRSKTKGGTQVRQAFSLISESG